MIGIIFVVISICMVGLFISNLYACLRQATQTKEVKKRYEK